MERTFIMVKPDGVQRNLVGEIIRRFENKGFKLAGLKLMSVSQELAEQHYDSLKDKAFFPGLVKFICSSPVVAMVWEGDNAVVTSRQMIGATNPHAAAPGTIRGDFGVAVGRNLIHGSDAIETAQREIALWFSEAELVTWETTLNPWLYEL
ncbi:MAG: nucleoside-diphosphate kinase [Cyanobacteriota bacterium]|nr:nucleoside-diphosphate kinase [Cyanobacteriota bacterium]